MTAIDPRPELEARVDDAEAVEQVTSAGSAPELPTPPSPPDDSFGAKMRGFVGELRPRVVTGGADVSPLLLLGVLNVVDGFDSNAYGVLLPEIRDYFGVSLSTITLITTLTGVLGILLALPVGYLTDRVNRLWLTFFGAVIWGGMAVMTGFAW